MFDNLIIKNETEINMMSPLTWAYVGDSVYELYVRTYLSNNTNLNPHKMHVEAIKYVKANAQAHILEELMEELSDEEKEIVRRGRNTENHHLPKHASHTDYMYSTAFEALIGYLYLTKQYKRLEVLIDKSIQIANKRRKSKINKVTLKDTLKQCLIGLYENPRVLPVDCYMW